MGKIILLLGANLNSPVTSQWLIACFSSKQPDLESGFPPPGHINKIPGWLFFGFFLVFVFLPLYCRAWFFFKIIWANFNLTNSYHCSGKTLTSLFSLGCFIAVVCKRNWSEHPYGPFEKINAWKCRELTLIAWEALSNRTFYIHLNARISFKKSTYSSIILLLDIFKCKLDKHLCRMV